MSSPKCSSVEIVTFSIVELREELEAKRNEIIIVILNLFDKRALMFSERWKWKKKKFDGLMLFTLNSVSYSSNLSSPKKHRAAHFYPKAMEHYDDDFYGLLQRKAFALL